MASATATALATLIIPTPTDRCPSGPGLSGLLEEMADAIAAVLENLDDTYMAYRDTLESLERQLRRVAGELFETESANTN